MRYFSLLILSLLTHLLYADSVDVFPATNGTGLCVGNDFVTLGDIQIFEDGTAAGINDIRVGETTDDTTGSAYITFKAPAQFQFKPDSSYGLGSIGLLLNGNFDTQADSSYVYVYQDSIVLRYRIENTNSQFDSITISGLQIKAISGPATGNILLTSGNFIIGDWPVDMVSHGALSSFDPVATISDSIDVSCFNGSDGQIVATPTGGDAPYTYSWSHNGGLNSDTAKNLTTGNYEVYVTDNSGCKDTSIMVNISQPIAVLNISMLDSTDIACKDDNTGAAEISSATGGTNPYTYSWSHNGGLNNTVASNLAAGNYTAYVTDNNGCIDSASVTINEPSTNLVFLPIDTIDVSCFGVGDGQAITGVSGGDGPYTYSWSHNGGLNNDTAKNLIPASYEAYILDGNGCRDTVAFLITQPTQLVATMIDSTDVSTCNADEGGAEVDGTGGTLPYTYSWSHDGGLNDSVATNLYAGDYTAYITDNNGCIDSASVNIDDGNCLDPGSVGYSDTICSGETPDPFLELISPTGGNGSYNYRWQYSDNNGLNWSNISGGSGDDPTYTSSATLTADRWYRRRVQSAGQTQYTDPIRIEISNSTASITSSPTQACINGNNIALTGSFSPAGGTAIFSGNPVSAVTNTGNNINGTFIPSNANSSIGGSSNIIRYTYTDLSGCIVKDSAEVIVYDSSAVNIIGLNTVYRVDNAPDTIHGIPSGGDFSSNIIFDSIFDPGLFSPSPPQIKVTYTYTDGNSCTSKATQFVTITDTTSGQIAGLSSDYCITDGIANLVGVPDSGHFIPTAGLTNDSITTGKFDPSLAPVDVPIEIKYAFTDGGGFPDTAVDIIVVHSLPVDSFQVLAPGYCVDDDTLALSGGLDNGGTGTFSGPGIINVNSTLGTAQFVPTLAGIGTSKNILYSRVDANTCANSFNRLVDIYALPTIAFMNFTDEYCADEEIDTIEVSDNGGIFSGNGIITDTIGNFDPASVTTGVPHAISYEYTDMNGCKNSIDSSITVNALPTPNIFNFSPRYCIDASPDSLTGSPSGGTFGGSGIVDIVNGVFSPSVAGAALANDSTHRIYYIYTDPSTACTDTSFKNLLVQGLPDPQIVPFDSSYCANASNRPLNGFGNPAPASNQLFSGPGVVGTNFSPTAFPQEAYGKDTFITYTYTDPYGCVNTTTHPIRVNPLPISNFNIGNNCADDSVSFLDSSYVISLDPMDSITSYLWNFGDLASGTGNTSTLKDPKHSFSSDGTFIIGLSVTTIYGCQAFFSKPENVDQPPQAAFSWQNTCFGDSVVFKWEGNPSVLGDDYIWNYGDGQIDTFSGAQAYLIQPKHSYDTLGERNVSLKVEASGCFNIDSTALSILPLINIIESNPYDEDFNSGQGGWFIDNTEVTNNSWEFGTPSGSFISEHDGDAWVTNLSGPYNTNEQSWVYSPCFRFDSVNRPVITMDVISKTTLADGATLQYRSKHSDSWVSLGDNNGLSGGLNWFNKRDILSNPGNQSQKQVGWSDTLGNAGEWYTAKHVLDEVKQALEGDPDAYATRFRIAFASLGSGGLADSSSEGFGFDNIYIGERNKVVLLEHFTSSADGDCAIQEESITTKTPLNDLVETFNNDMASIYYHVSLAGTDQMNLDNRNDPGARVFFNGVSKVPRSFLDGNYYAGDPSGVDEGTINFRTLDPAKFSLDINFEFSGDSSVIDASVVVEALDNITTNTEYTIHLAVIERKITDGSVVGTNGQTTFVNVLKKMLPDAAGTNIVRSWTQGEIYTVNQSWSIANVYNKSQLDIVAFIQDNNTKEVFQAGYGNPEPIVIGIKDQYSLSNSIDLKLFPNPTTDLLNITLNKVTYKNNYSIKVYDRLGKEVLRKVIPIGTDYISINTEALSVGTYVLAVEDNKSKALIGNKQLFVKVD